jgi:hypothetical protein
MVTGTIQVISFLIYLFFWEKIDKSLHKHFIVYGITMIIIVFVFFTSMSFNHPMTLLVIFASALLAVYFLFISKWQTDYFIQSENNKNL